MREATEGAWAAMHCLALDEVVELRVVLEPALAEAAALVVLRLLDVCT